MKITTLIFASASVLALSAATASAEIVCNSDGDCWHAKERVEYRPELRIQVHPDDWKWRETEHYKFREHDGRGYWHGGTWVEIK